MNNIKPLRRNKQLEKYFIVYKRVVLPKISVDQVSNYHNSSIKTTTRSDALTPKFARFYVKLSTHMIFLEFLEH